MIEPTIREVAPMTVAYFVGHGPYAQIPTELGQLYHWAVGRGLNPTGVPMGVYPLVPGEVPEEQAVWELWAPVSGDVEERDPDESGHGVKRVPATTVAAAVHCGPYDGVEPVYQELSQWVSAHGHEVVAPPREAYMSDPAEVPLDEHVTEIQLPLHIL